MMKVKWWFMVALLMPGCICYEVSVYEDKITGTKTVALRGNEIGMDYTHRVWLNIELIQEQPIPTIYLTPVLKSQRWFSLQDYQSLQIRADDEQMLFSKLGGSDQKDASAFYLGLGVRSGNSYVYSGGTTVCIWEAAKYRVTRRQLEKIANAEVVWVKLVGARYHIQHKFSSPNSKNFRAFMREYLPEEIPGEPEQIEPEEAGELERIDIGIVEPEEAPEAAPVLP